MMLWSSSLTLQIHSNSAPTTEIQEKGKGKLGGDGGRIEGGKERKDGGRVLTGGMGDGRRCQG